MHKWCFEDLIDASLVLDYCDAINRAEQEDVEDQQEKALGDANKRAQTTRL